MDALNAHLRQADLVGHPEKANALLILHSQHIPAKNVVRVYPDSVLYLGADGAPCTAWLRRDPANFTLSIHVEAGFPAEEAA